MSLFRKIPRVFATFSKDKDDELPSGRPRKGTRSDRASDGFFPAIIQKKWEAL